MRTLAEQVASLKGSGKVSATPSTEIQGEGVAEVNIPTSGAGQINEESVTTHNPPLVPSSVDTTASPSEDPAGLAPGAPTDPIQDASADPAQDAADHFVDNLFNPDAAEPSAQN